MTNYIRNTLLVGAALVAGYRAGRIKEQSEAANTKRTMTIAQETREVPVYIMADKEYASSVLEYLRTMANYWDSVSIGDYLEHIGAISDSYWYTEYGWHPEDLEQATLVELQRGWVIKFPPVKLIN